MLLREFSHSGKERLVFCYLREIFHFCNKLDFCAILTKRYLMHHQVFFLFAFFQSLLSLSETSLLLHVKYWFRFDLWFVCMYVAFHCGSDLS